MPFNEWRNSCGTCGAAEGEYHKNACPYKRQIIALPDMAELQPYAGYPLVKEYEPPPLRKPSTERLELDGAVGHFFGLACAAYNTDGDGYDRVAIDRALDRLDRAIRDYRGMKTFPAKAMR